MSGFNEAGRASRGVCPANSAPLAQRIRAPRFGRGGQGFESLKGRQNLRETWRLRVSAYAEGYGGSS